MSFSGNLLSSGSQSHPWWSIQRLFHCSAEKHLNRVWVPAVVFHWPIHHLLFVLRNASAIWIQSPAHTCVPFVWDIQVQTQISLSCPRSQLHSFCGLLWNVPVKNALAICANHAAFHLTNSSAFRIQLRNWKISVWWELLWYTTTILGFLWSGSQTSRPLRISSLSYGLMLFQSLQTEIKAWKYLSPWHPQDTKSVDLGPD